MLDLSPLQLCNELVFFAVQFHDLEGKIWKKNYYFFFFKHTATTSRDKNNAHMHRIFVIAKIQ